MFFELPLIFSNYQRLLLMRHLVDIADSFYWKLIWLLSLRYILLNLGQPFLVWCLFHLVQGIPCFIFLTLTRDLENIPWYLLEYGETDLKLIGTPEDEELAQIALETAKRSYAHYTRSYSAVAIRTKSGNIVSFLSYSNL